MRQPSVMTCAWNCIPTPPTPGTCSPECAFTNCHAATRSSNLKTAPLIERTVAGARFLAPDDAFAADVFLA